MHLGEPWHWVAFNLLILFVLFIDLFVIQRKSEEPKMAKSIAWAGFCILLALLFGVAIWVYTDSHKGMEYFTAYVTEEALSIDNLFVFMVIFSYFAVPRSAQHIVLFWGIIGVIVTRGAFILIGLELIKSLEWILYVLGALLVFTGLKILFMKEGEIRPEKNPVIGLIKRIFPMTDTYHGKKFFIKVDGKRLATPLVLVIAVVETTDVMFAVDSVPAVFGITRDPFIAYTSNIFAVLGLRALFFVISGFLGKFRYLKPALAIVLAFIGIKMCVHKWIELPREATFGVVLGIITLSVVLSLVIPERKKLDNEPTTEKEETAEPKP